MADINKNLRVKAVLDDQQLKQQIRQLKQELGEGFSFQSMDLSGMEKAFDTIANKFTDQIKKSIQELQQSNIKVRTTATGQRGGRTDPREFGGNYQNFVQKFNQESQNQQFKEQAQRLQKEKKIQQELQRFNEQSREQAFNEKVKDLEQIAKKREQLEERFQKKQSTRRRQAARERLKTYKANLQERQRLEQTVTYGAMRRMGATRQGARQAAGMEDFVATSALGRFGGAAGRTASAVGGLGRAALTGGLGVGGALAAGAVGVGALGVGAAMAGSRYIGRQRDVYRPLEARREQEYGMGVLQGNIFEGITRRRARENVSGFERGFRGVTGTLSALTGIGGEMDIIGAITGEAGRANIRQTEEREQQAVLAETALARQAAGRAMQLRGARVQAMRGGGITGQRLTGIQAGGARQGFGIEETLQQFTAARQFLGNQPAGANLETMQNIMQRTGVGVGQQARAAELIAGAGGGTVGEGVQRQIEILKKGVAAGLDASKSGQFLQTTSEYIEQNVGLGRMDVGGATDRLATLARGFAGPEGRVGTVELRQAQQFAQMRRRESMATGGFAGVGNVLGIQQAMPNATAGQMLAGMQLSSDASAEDIMEAMNVDEETAGRIRAAMQDTARTGLGAAGVGARTPLGRSLLARERGIATEQQLGAERAAQFEGIPEMLRRPSAAEAEGGPLLPRADSAELRSLREQFTQQNEVFAEGAKLLAGSTQTLKDNFDGLIEKVRELTSELESYTNTQRAVAGD